MAYLCNDTTSSSVVPNTSWAMLVLGRVKIYRQKTLWGDRRDPLARKKLEESDGKVRKKKTRSFCFKCKETGCLGYIGDYTTQFFGDDKNPLCIRIPKKQVGFNGKYPAGFFHCG